jgi:hypothetical protein
MARRWALDGKWRTGSFSLRGVGYSNAAAAHRTWMNVCAGKNSGGSSIGSFPRHRSQRFLETLNRLVGVEHVDENQSPLPGDGTADL